MATQNEKQCNIVKRLEELNKWQEEQKRLLEERQNRQRQILGIEQQTMYEMLGLCGENTAGDPLDNRNSKEELQQKQHKQQNSQESMENIPIKEDADSADYEDVEDFIGEYTEEDFEECKDPLVVPDAIAPEVSSVDEIEDECETATEAENETDNSLDNDGGNNSKCLDSNDYSNITPSPSNESHDEFLQQFKHALFAALQLKADNPSDTNSTPSTTTLTLKDSELISPAIQKAIEELQEKTDLIKLRLCELEREINTFKENNVQLMKIKEEHELEKNLQAQEHLKAMGRLKDEKVQVEIRLHEERMKLEEERRKLEQQSRSKTQAFMAKKRKEVEKLREQLIQIETRLKGKEHTHMAAQARLRSQMRNTERDQKKLHEEIERLTKENKRLEGENLRISREQNNKLLQEINRNIARLASPKAKNKRRFTPRKSVSKTIVTVAVVNRLQRQSAMGYFQAPKKSKAGNRSSRNGDKRNKMSLTSGAETETTPDTRIREDTSSQKAELPAQGAYCLTEQQQEQRRQYEEGLPIGIEDTPKIIRGVNTPMAHQETRCSNGHVRLKDKDGNLVLDTESKP
uniref:Uncharacterized protein n=1 Tax=Glossina palpalis gambiensis TaxID=67801 RepID=A0A1B0BMZ9_9MUSC